MNMTTKLGRYASISATKIAAVVHLHFPVDIKPSKQNTQYIANAPLRSIPIDNKRAHSRDPEIQRLIQLCHEHAQNNGYLSFLYECIRDRMNTLYQGMDDREIRTMINKQIQSLMCDNGRILEDKAIGVYSQMHSTHVIERNTNTLSNLYSFTHGSPKKNYSVLITGRIDGYEPCTGRVIEIKTRQYGFSKSLTLRERIQLFVYMYLRKSKSSALVEYYAGTTKILKVVHWDDEEWKRYMTIMERHIVNTLSR